MAASQPPWQIKEHINEAKRNYDRHNLMLERDENVSWAAVFLFYSAIHIVQSYAQRDTPTDIPSNHEQRRSYVARHLPADIAANYTTLDDVSMQVRYRLRGKSLADIRTLHDNHFAKIRRYFREQLSTAWISPNTPTDVDAEVRDT